MSPSSPTSSAPAIRPRYGGLVGVALRTILVMLCWTPLMVAVLAMFELSFMAREIPDVPSLDVLQPTFQSRIQLLDGTRVSGAHATSHVPYELLPPELLITFLAAEDEDFFTHTAFNLRAIARAALENFRSGQRTQGASTLSQQLAKQFTGSQRSYQRKVQELLLARRMEATFSKHELLRAYLETAFMGHTAYGVTQASWLYFERDPRELDQGQLATLAGILPSPNRFSPLRHPDRALERRDRVLRRLHDMGVLDDRQLAYWLARPLDVRPREAEPEVVGYPYIHGAALRILTDDGQNSMLDMWSEGAYTLTMTPMPDAQIVARQALWQAAERYDRRQGLHDLFARDPKTFTPEEKLFAETIFTQATIEELSPTTMTLRAEDHEPITLTIEDLRWASSEELDRHYKKPRKIDGLSDSFAVGQRVLLRWSGEHERWQLTQPLRLQGALFSMDSITGQTIASVGGVEPAIDIYHRAEQACRQPGSVFKPLVYTPALQIGIHPATMLGDVPRELDNVAHGGTWNPRNADRNYKGFITMKQALAGSRNIPAAYLFDRVGSRRVIDLARKLGIRDTLDPAPSLALGSSCVKPIEMTAVYTAFQREGLPLTPNSLALWTDDGARDPRDAVIERHQHFAYPFLSLSERFMAMREELSGKRPARAMAREIAATMWWMLRQVALTGTAHELPKSWPVAAKTGTTNDFDAWFIGFDGRRTTGVWMGSDRNKHELGRGEHGATVAMPAFREFYSQLYVDPTFTADQLEWEAIFPMDRITFVRIDEPTGLLARPNQYGVEYPFTSGQEPVEYAPPTSTRRIEQLDLLTQGL